MFPFGVNYGQTKWTKKFKYQIANEDKYQRIHVLSYTNFNPGQKHGEIFYDLTTYLTLYGKKYNMGSKNEYATHP